MDQDIFLYAGDEGDKCKYCDLPYAVNREQIKDWENFCVQAVGIDKLPIKHGGEHICQDCYDEVMCGERDHAAEQEIYGDAERDEYTQSASYREECERERWEWLKFEG